MGMPGPPLRGKARTPSFAEPPLTWVRVRAGVLVSVSSLWTGALLLGTVVLNQSGQRRLLQNFLPSHSCPPGESVRSRHSATRILEGDRERIENPHFPIIIFNFSPALRFPGEIFIVVCSRVQCTHEGLFHYFPRRRGIWVFWTLLFSVQLQDPPLFSLRVLSLLILVITTVNSYWAFMGARHRTMYAVFLESWPSLEVGGVIHPHFMDENIEVQGPSGSGRAACRWYRKELSLPKIKARALREPFHPPQSSEMPGLAALNISLIQSTHSTYVPTWRS